MKHNLFNDTFKTVFAWVLMLQFVVMLSGILFIFKPFLQNSLNTISSKIIEVTEGLEHSHFTLELLTDMSQYNKSWLLFNSLLSRRLKSTLQNSDVTIYEHPKVKSTYIVVIKSNNKLTAVSFPHKVIGTQPALTFVLFLLSILLSSISVSWIIANKQKRVFQNLAEHALQIGKGQFHLQDKQFDIVEIQHLFDNIKTMSLALLQAQKDKTLILAGISHDLRTPITRLYLQLAINEKKIPLSLLQNIEEELKQIETMIDLFLVQSQQEYQPDACLKTIECTEWLSKLINKYQQPRLVIIALDRVNITTNIVVLERVLQNIIDNALKYTNQNIELSFREHDQSVTFTIKDFGEGVSDLYLAKLNQPFIQGNSNFEGVGLGLSIVQYLASQQGWNITYKNQVKPLSGIIVELTL